MRWDRNVLAYHGCDEALAKRVVLHEEPLRPSANEYDWLGHGCYFWEGSRQRAARWAQEEIRLRRGRTSAPAVLGAVINLGNCLDLTDVEGLELVRDAHSRLGSLLAELGRPTPQNTGPEFGARKLDCAVFEALHVFRRREGKPPFQTIRAFFVEGEPLYPGAGLRTLDHVQICVRDPGCVLGYFLPPALHSS